MYFMEIERFQNREFTVDCAGATNTREVCRRLTGRVGWGKPNPSLDATYDILSALIEPGDIHLTFDNISMLPNSERLRLEDILAASARRRKEVGTGDVLWEFVDDGKLGIISGIRGFLSRFFFG